MSARSFSQAEMPLGFAFRLYDAFSAAVQRKCTCSVALALAGRGGLPRLGLSMADIMSHNKVVDNPPRQVFNVYTLNKEAPMDYGYPDTKEKRQAGMAAFRARLLKAHERFANDPSLSAKDRAYQRELCESIKKAQAKFGEIK